MSTNHTRNYALSQWEASDQVVRTDFNADNAKIDAALSSLSTAFLNRFKPELIQEIHLEAGINKFTVDTTGITWSDWIFVIVTAHIPHTMYGEHSCLTINGRELNISTDNSENHALIMYTGHSSSGPIRAIGFPTGKINYKIASYSEISQLSFSMYNMGALRENSKVWIYGLK